MQKLTLSQRKAVHELKETLQAQLSGSELLNTMTKRGKVVSNDYGSATCLNSKRLTEISDSIKTFNQIMASYEAVTPLLSFFCLIPSRLHQVVKVFLFKYYNGLL